MSNHEIEARKLKNKGNNCSNSLYSAFSKDVKLGGEYPNPRSVDGKCGALLTALKILEETGHGDKKEEFEKEFIKRFKYTKCIDLMTFERRCNDYVGESAKLLDEILAK